MSLRLVQLGDGSPRDVVVIYHYTGELDAAVKAAAPRALIVNDTRPPHTYDGLPTLDAALERARALAGDPYLEIARTVLCGFSEGVMCTRAVLNQGGRLPDALVLADGTHGSLPVVDSQYAAWRAFAELSKSGSRAMVASHTMIATEVPPQPYVSAVHGLRLVTGWPLNVTGPNDAPVRRQEGALVVYSFSGIDAPAHVFQARSAFPMMLKEAMSLLEGRRGGDEGSGGGAAALALGACALAALYFWG